MRILIPLSLILAFAATASAAEDEKPVESIVPAIDLVIPSTEGPASTDPAATNETDAAPQTSSTESQEPSGEESAPPEVVSESQE